MKLIKKSGLVISKEYENSEFFIRIKSFLTRYSQEYNKSTYVMNKFYLESEKFLLIPRNFPIQQYIFDYELDDRTCEGETIDIKHIITPRSESQTKAMNYIMTNDSGILQLAPGVGKTVITIYMIATRKKKSLILVHRDSLAEQWKKRVMDFTNISFDNIARLSSQTFEEDLKKPIIIVTAQTFLSLLNRNRKQFLTELHNANIGIFVADEVHTSVGAPTFSECSIHMPSRYAYGLSATPYRFDGNADIINFHLGDIYEDEDVEGTMDSRVNVIMLDYEIDTPRRYRYIYWAGVFQRTRYLNMLKKSTIFLDVLKGLMNKLKVDRNIILICERTKLIDELYDWLDWPNKSKFYKSATLRELNQSFTFATPGKCRDGIDAPWKDTVIITSPISNINQLTGRVNRSYPGKKTPIIIDMVDYGCKPIMKTFYTRKSFYNKKGWPINYILIKDNKHIKIEESVAMDIMEGR